RGRTGPGQGGQPRGPGRDHAEAVVDHPLVPERRAQPRGQRGIAGRAGRQRRLERFDAAVATSADGTTGPPAGPAPNRPANRSPAATLAASSSHSVPASAWVTVIASLPAALRRGRSGR